MGRANTPNDVFKYIDIPLDESDEPLPAFSADKPINCWNWTSSLWDKGRRPAFRLQGTHVLAYRIVWEVFYGTPVPDGHVIRHKCDNSLCCRPEHMDTGTPRQNMADMVLRGRHHGAGVAVVERARHLMETTNLTDREIGEQLGFSQKWSNDIRNMKRYWQLPWPWGEARLLLFHGIDIAKKREALELEGIT